MEQELSTNLLISSINTRFCSLSHYFELFFPPTVMRELELTSNAALTDAVYETALNGSFLEVKLVAGSVGDDEPRGIQPEYECYHISYPDKKDTILFEQPLDAADDKVTVYDLGKKIKSIEGCCHKTLTKGESRTATARKVVAHGPMWLLLSGWIKQAPNHLL